MKLDKAVFYMLIWAVGEIPKPRQQKGRYFKMSIRRVAMNSPAVSV